MGWITNSKQNRGNRNTGQGKAPTNEDIGNNNQFMERLVQEHGPTEDGKPGCPFWVPEDGTENSEERPADGTVSQCGWVTFPNEYPVYSAYTLEGLRWLCNPAKRARKNNTKHLKATPYEHLQIIKVLSPEDNNSGIRVFNQKHQGPAFLLVQFSVRTESKPKPKPVPESSLVARLRESTATACVVQAMRTNNGKQKRTSQGKCMECKKKGITVCNLCVSVDKEHEGSYHCCDGDCFKNHMQKKHSDKLAQVVAGSESDDTSSKKRKSS